MSSVTLIYQFNYLDEQQAVFDDLQITEPGLDYSIIVTCSSDDPEQVLSAAAPPFHVYSFPETGLLKKSAVEFDYRGPYTAISSLVSNFASSMGSMTCDGCPSESGNPTKESRRKRDVGNSRANIGLAALQKVHFPTCFGGGICPDFKEKQTLNPMLEGTFCLKLSSI